MRSDRVPCARQECQVSRLDCYVHSPVEARLLGRGTHCVAWMSDGSTESAGEVTASDGCAEPAPWSGLLAPLRGDVGACKRRRSNFGSHSPRLRARRVTGYAVSAVLPLLPNTISPDHCAPPALWSVEREHNYEVRSNPVRQSGMPSSSVNTRPLCSTQAAGDDVENTARVKYPRLTSHRLNQHKCMRAQSVCRGLNVSRGYDRPAGAPCLPVGLRKARDDRADYGAVGQGRVWPSNILTSSTHSKVKRLASSVGDRKPTTS